MWQIQDIIATLLINARIKWLTWMITNQKLWLSCLLSISLLNLCLSLPGSTMTHPRHISHASSYTRCTGCLQIRARHVPNTHTQKTQTRRILATQICMWAAHASHTHTRHWQACLTHKPAAITRAERTRCSLLAFALCKCISIGCPCLPSFASLLL